MLYLKWSSFAREYVGMYSLILDLIKQHIVCLIKCLIMDRLESFLIMMLARFYEQLPYINGTGAAQVSVAVTSDLTVGQSKSEGKYFEPKPNKARHAYNCFEPTPNKGRHGQLLRKHTKLIETGIAVLKLNQIQQMRHVCIKSVPSKASDA